MLFSLHVESRWTPIHFLGRNSFFLESYNYAHFQIDRYITDPTMEIVVLQQYSYRHLFKALCYKLQEFIYTTVIKKNEVS